jgi:hypothetical protein
LAWAGPYTRFVAVLSILVLEADDRRVGTAKADAALGSISARVAARCVR